MDRLASLLFCVYTLAVVINQPRTTKTADKKSALSTTNSSASLDNQCLQMLCSESNYNCFGIECSQNGPLLIYGYCATFNEDTKLLSMTKCQYFEPKWYNVTSSQHILLPRNISQLNDYMCRPLNRKGLVCSECADGCGLSETSFGYRCVKCTQSNAWYGVSLLLFTTFIPITIFYIIVLVFQINIVSAPMPCFILYAQLVVFVFDPDHYISSIDDKNLTEDIKIMLTLYGIFNLYFGHHINILPPYCLSKHLKFIHLAILGYISAFYPIALIFLTWLCVEQHGRNFRPLVWLWRPFHRCFVRLRRGWDTKSDIIDVFATFFFLSYNRILYQTILLISNKSVKHFDISGRYFITYHSQIDMRISYGSVHHLSLETLAILIATVCVFLPPLMLILYPFKRFRSCLSRCHINFIAIQIFMDKVYSCYKEGLDGGRDMRSFSGLYFLLRITAYLCTLLSHPLWPLLHINKWMTLGTLTFFTTLTIAIAKPYRKAYMNYWDIAILSHLATLLYVLSLGKHALPLVRILLSIPIFIFVLVIIFRKAYDVCKVHSKLLLQKCCNCFKSCRSMADTEGNWRLTVNSSIESEPLIQPISTIITNNYGVESNKAT